MTTLTKITQTDNWVGYRIRLNGGFTYTLSMCTQRGKAGYTLYNGRCHIFQAEHTQPDFSIASAIELLKGLPVASDYTPAQLAFIRSNHYKEISSMLSNMNW